MPILPHDRFALDSPLSPEHAAARLAEVVERRQLLRIGRWPNTREFEGEVGEGSFAIQRILRYRNPFRPLIRGTIEARERGSRLQGTMSLHPLAIASVGLLIGMGAVGLLAILLGVIPDGPTGAGRLAPLMPMAVLVLLVSAAFAHEARAARTILMDRLAATDAGRERPD
jgi:hypothetical protein